MSNLTYAQYLNKVSYDVTWYTSIVTSSIGIPCNILSIFVFARLMKNKTNMGYLYIWQCSVDLVLLFLLLFLFRSTQTFGVNLYLLNDSMCRFLTYLRRFIIHASSWMAVIATFDRFIFIMFDHHDRFMFMKRKRNLTAILISILVILALADIPNLLFYVNAKNSCTGDDPAVISSDIISIILRTYLPFFLMILFNAFIIRKIFKHSRQAKISHIHLNNNNTRLKEYQFTLAVVAYDVYFFILNFPMSVYYIMYDVNLYSGALKGSDAVFAASYALANSVTGMISNFVQTLSFFTYLAFNKLFRVEFLRVMRRFLCILSIGLVHPELTESVTNYKLNH